MNVFAILIVLASLLQGISNSSGHSAPPEARKTTYQLSEAAHLMINVVDARTLADDAVFVRTLTEVLKNPQFTDADRADAFFLMRMKFDWAFIGAAAIPPGFTYDRVFGMYLDTYRGYRKGLGNGHDVRGLLELAKLPQPQHIARASSALLLAAVLDPESTRATVVALSDPELVAASAAPPIAIHHLSLCAALCGVGDDGFTKLAALASRFAFEESQEDILLAMAYADSPRNRELIQKFAEEHAPKKFDLAVRLALTIVRARQSPEEFQTWIKPLAAQADSEERKKSILDWSAAELRPIGPFHPQRGMKKIWDGFQATIYEDGVQLKFGDSFLGFVATE